MSVSESEQYCPTCRRSLIADAEPAKFLGCPTCHIYSALDENNEIVEFKMLILADFNKLFAKNPTIIAQLSEKKERLMLNLVWLLMFVILLIVSFILSATVRFEFFI